MKIFFKLFAFVAMISFVMSSCIADKNFVIEGTLSGVEEGTVIQIFSSDEEVLTYVDSTRLVNGKFRFDIAMPCDSVFFVYLLVGDNYGSLPRLWVGQRTHTTINGNGWNYADWKIAGGAPEQCTENHILEATRLLRKAGNERVNSFLTGGLQGITPEDRKEVIAFYQRGAAMSIEDIDLRSAICDALQECDVDQAFVANLYEAARCIDDCVLEKARVQYYRLSDVQKRSRYGSMLKWTLFPQAKVEIGGKLYDAVLYDTEGGEHQLAEFNGKYLLLDFWFAGCRPCFEAIPELKQIEANYNGELVVVSINSDDVDVWKEASASIGITGNNFNDYNGKTGFVSHYVGQNDGYPMFYLIAPDGTVLGSTVGYRSGSLIEFVNGTMQSGHMEMETEVRAPKQAKNVAQGNKYRDVKAKGVDGCELMLSDIVSRNRYVLLEFWATWCAPCMGEIPHLVEAYEAYKDKGFEIYSYSLDDNADTWVATLKEKDLRWVNVRYEDTDATAKYGVRGVPSNFLIDCSTGNIIATNLRGNALIDKLDELLNSK